MKLVIIQFVLELKATICLQTSETGMQSIQGQIRTNGICGLLG